MVREQAALVGHDLRWKDDLAGSVIDEKRGPSRPRARPTFRPSPPRRQGRIVAAVDVGAAFAPRRSATLIPARWNAFAGGVLAYHAPLAGRAQHAGGG